MDLCGKQSCVQNCQNPNRNDLFLQDGCSTRGHSVCHGSQYKLESASEMYCAQKAHQVPSHHHVLPKPNYNRKWGKKELPKFLSAQPEFFFHPFLTLLRENPPAWGSIKWLLTLHSIYLMNETSEGSNTMQVEWSLKRFPKNSPTDIYCKLHSNELCNDESNPPTGPLSSQHEGGLARGTAPLSQEL